MHTKVDKIREFFPNFMEKLLPPLDNGGAADVYLPDNSQRAVHSTEVIDNENRSESDNNELFFTNFNNLSTVFRQPGRRARTVAAGAFPHPAERQGSLVPRNPIVYAFN